MLSHMHWLGHSGIKITGSKVVYLDPYQIERGETADFIFITHAHYDHFSPVDIDQIIDDRTTIIAPFEISELYENQVSRIAVDDILKLDGIEVRGIAAYNIGKSYHPKQDGNVGYLFVLDGQTYYHAGDTDVIPEMKGLQADIVFLPVSGTFTMNAQEAAQAAGMIKPKLAIPIHWGCVAGSSEDADLFIQFCSDCEAQILPQE